MTAMTAMTAEAPPAALDTLTEEQLAEIYSAGSDQDRAAVLTVLRRRDQRDQQARRREALYAEWREWAHADYLAAEARACGNLLSAEGERHTTEPMRLWSMPEHTARLWASEELRAHWDETSNGHMTFSRYLRQRAMSRRVDRDREATDTTEETNVQDTEAVMARYAARTAARAAREAAGSAPVYVPGEHAIRAKARQDRIATAKLTAGIPDRARARSTEAPARPGAALTAVPAWKPPAKTPEEEAAEALAAREALRAAIEEAEARYLRFTYLPQGWHAALVMALWAAVANIPDAFSFMPFVRVVSPHEGCGKSLVLELTSHLVPAADIILDPTAAALREIVGNGTVPLIDEIDGLVTRRDAGLRALVAGLNACYRRGAGIARVAGRTAVFTACMLAGIDEGVPKLSSVRALFSRAFRIDLALPPDEEMPERYRAGDHEAAGRQLGKTLRDAVVALGGELAAMRPMLPDGIALRAADISEPLAAVADLAGGDLPERAREALAYILGDPGAAGAPQTPGQAALDGLAAVWDGESMTLPDITRRMMALPGAPWASTWTAASAPRELAALLEGAGIYAQPIAGADGLTRLGLVLADVEHLWSPPAEAVPAG